MFNGRNSGPLSLSTIEQKKGWGISTTEITELTETEGKALKFLICEGGNFILTCMKKFDVLVIGSGGGSKLVKPVSKKGLKVAVVEMHKFGGTCLNHGCIPSKMLIHVADVATTIREAAKFQLKVSQDIEVDFEALVTRVSDTIDRESAAITPVYEKDPHITYYHGEARFVSEKIVRVMGEEITADKIFLAVGARPRIPPIPGLKGTPYMTYMEALRLKKQPKKLIVIGGSYVALELGYFFAALGTETHFVVREKVLRYEDEAVQEEFKAHFLYPLHLGWIPERVSYEGGEFTLTCNHGILKGDALLVATGMKPWTDILGLEKTKIEVDEGGYVKVDEFLKTTQPGVWAFGDCIGRYFFRHSANFEGEYLFKTLFDAPQHEPLVYRPVPHAVFTRPQIAAVGPTEEELKAQRIDYVVGQSPYTKSGMGMALLADYGFVKLIFDRGSRELIAAHVIGEEASNMIHMLIAYMNKGGTVEDLREMIYIHPALPEVVRSAARHAPF